MMILVTIPDVVDADAALEVGLAPERVSLREEVRRLVRHLYSRSVAGKNVTLHAHLEDFVSGCVCE